jgi:hypothetical protein
VHREVAPLLVGELAERAHRADRGLERLERVERRLGAHVLPMRSSAAFGTRQPTSFITSLRTGEPGMPARIMPMMPPIEVPSQSTVSAAGSR